MSHLYTLTGPEQDDPTYLTITTTDDGLIQDMAMPFYRASDAITKKLVTDWQEYATSTGSPSPDQQDIVQFKDWLATAYGPAYRVVQLG